MIPLHARGTAATSWPEAVIGRVASTSILDGRRQEYILRVEDQSVAEDIEGYAGVISEAAEFKPTGVPTLVSVSTRHVSDGDIVVLEPGGSMRTAYRNGSKSNFLFTTDRCNSYCLMCSQPPKNVDDRWRVRELLRVIELIDSSCSALCITGGEPTILRDDLVRLLGSCRDRLPKTPIHVLSNGRLFYYDGLARAVAAVNHPDVMFGIPLYSDLDWHHDYVVQAKGAFYQTLVGLHNLGRYGVPVEIRVVIHRHTYHRLGALAEFIYRNLTFVSHVALMGLEPTGFAVPHLSELWVDPADYQSELQDATLFLSERGMNVSIYNHQLCTVREGLRSFCRQSISDWKNEFLPVCADCAVKDECSGFFTSSLERRHSRAIAAIQDRTVSS